MQILNQLQELLSRISYQKNLDLATIQRKTFKCGHHNNERLPEENILNSFWLQYTQMDPWISWNFQIKWHQIRVIKYLQVIRDVKNLHITKAKKTTMF